MNLASRGDTLVLSAAENRLQLDRGPSGEQLTLHHLPSGVHFSGRPGPLWRAGFEDEHGVERVVTSADCPSFGWDSSESPTQVVSALRWSGPLAEAEASVVLEKHTGLSYWTLTVTSRPAGWRVAWVEFPILRVSSESAPQSLSIPWLAGILIHQPLERLGTYRETYPGPLSMQFTSYTAGEATLYYACTDSEGYLKKLEATAEDGAIRLSWRHSPPIEPGQGRYAMPYSVALGAFAGGWQEAARTYREWASKQRWARRRDVPKWLREFDLWVWNRGPSAHVLPGAIELQVRLNANVALDWYWWHRCAYDADFPEYFPPREGHESFWRAIEEAHIEGVRIMPYVNARLWGTKTKSWPTENAFHAACKKSEGSLYAEVPNRFAGAELAVMCPWTEEWQAKVASIVEHLVKNYDVDAVYLDCIGCAYTTPCYDPGHGHPIGPGKHWAEGYRMMIEAIRSRIGPNVALTTESCVELYLDQFDAILNIDAGLERYGWLDQRFGDGGEPIPLSAAVYHDTAIAFGSASPLIPKIPRDPLWNAPPPPFDPQKRIFKEQAILELARNFLWGNQLLLANITPDELDRPEVQDIVQFLNRLLQARRDNRRFLLDGVFGSILSIECEHVDIPCGVIWLYAEEGPPQVNIRKSPAVLGSTWRDAEGKTATFLVNITKENREVALKWGDEARKLVVPALDCIVLMGE